MDKPATRPATRSAYGERINRVIQAMAADPDRRWRLDELAAIACFSTYHFHRVYRAVTGETVEDTRRRWLLRRAAADLADTSLPIARVAGRAGYGSIAAFSRAFSADYGRPPGQYRRWGGSTRAVARATQEEAMFEVKIENQEPLRLVGLTHRGDYQTINATFGRLMAIGHGEGLFGAGGRMVALYFDDPEGTPVDALRSFAGVTSAAGVAQIDGLERMDVPAGPVASVVYTGPYAELREAYQFLYRDWLPASGREPADSPPYEFYLNDPRRLPPSEWQTQVCLPLKP